MKNITAIIISIVVDDIFLAFVIIREKKEFEVLESGFTALAILFIFTKLFILYIYYWEEINTHVKRIIFKEYIQ